jgi:hypothetical protein
MMCRHTRNGIVLVLLLLAGDALAHSTLSGVTVTRAFSPATAQPGQQVTVTLTVETGALSESLRGFYLSEAVPDALSPSSGSATLDGQAVTVQSERTAAGTVYTGATTLRWVLEQPPDWSENEPLPASSTLVVTYQVDVPAGATTGFSFPGASWVGMLTSLGDAGDHFGYEDTATTLPVDVPPRLGLDSTSLSFSAQEGGSNPDSQRVVVSNAGDGTLAQVETAVTYGDTGSGWLTVTRSDSGEDQHLDNAVDLDGLAPNTHTATVQVSATGASNSPQSYTVAFTVTARPSTTEPTIVLDPTSLSFTAEEGGAAPAAQTVEVTNSGAGTMAAITTEVSYISGADWLEVTAGGADNTQTVETLVDPSGLAPDTYTATVAVSSAGASNTPQNYAVSFTVTPAPPAAADAGSDQGISPTGDGGIGGADGGSHTLDGTGQLVGGCNLGRPVSPVASLLLLCLVLLPLGGTRRRR